MKVLVIGSGAREHALVAALSRDPMVHTVIAAPGNPGIDVMCETRPVDATDPQAVTALAQECDASLVVIGPEAPLVAGVSDALRAAGIAVFGPSQAAAALEGSKAFAKEVMDAAKVPTAASVAATSAQEAHEALTRFGAPHVVKADGLAAGKGVVVTRDFDEALNHAVACLEESDRVVIEDFLDGPEVSLFVVCDGTTAMPLAPAQDFKRALDGDQGPNTGGMGAYSPLPWAPDHLVDEIVERVAQPVVDEMARRGTPFVGLLYCGLALTKNGIEVVEFNVRFGDPETQSVLSRLETPLGALLLAAAQGRLSEYSHLEWSADASVTLVLAAEGYPASPRKGDPIAGLEEAGAVDGVMVLHAGTAVNDQGEVVTNGGRVLSVVANAPSLQEARELAYRAGDLITWEGKTYRNDIASAAVQGAIRVPVAAGSEEVEDAVENDAEGARAPRSSVAWWASQAPQVPGWTHVYSGKVRDLYIPVEAKDMDDADRLLMVASDRISAYDHVIPTPIPDKGKVLTGLTAWWFDQVSDLIGNHVLTVDVPAEVAGRGMIVKPLRMFPVECVARGHLTGSGLKDYQNTGAVCGNELPEGLGEASKLEPAIFTPATKAELGDHDENITFDQTVELLGDSDAEALKSLTLALFERARSIAAERGVILADTKFEFGRDFTGQIVLGDEVLTPDSSRFWDAEGFVEGQSQPSFDKQFVRDWLTSEESGWDKDSGVAPPQLPTQVVEATRARYIEAFERLTGRKFPG